MTTRLKRDGHAPDFVSGAADHIDLFRRAIPLPSYLQGYSLRFRSRNWSALNGFDAVQFRAVTALFTLGEEAVGGYQFHEYDISGCESDFEFLDAMDSVDGYEADLASAVCEKWLGSPRLVRPRRHGYFRRGAHAKYNIW